MFFSKEFGNVCVYEDVSQIPKGVQYFQAEMPERTLEHCTLFVDIATQTVRWQEVANIDVAPYEPPKTDVEIKMEEQAASIDTLKRSLLDLTMAMGAGGVR